MFANGSSRHQELALIGHALDNGINLFDTADMYSHGQSEVLVGKAVKSRRAEVVLATKGGYLRPAQSLLGRVKPILAPVVRALKVKRPGGAAAGAGASIDQDFSPRHLVEALEASLRRLKTDYVDIYQLHSPPRSVVDAGEFVEVLEGLKRQGKIRYYGVAVDAADVAGGLDRHPTVASLQLPFSAIDQEAASSVLAQAATLGIGVIARSCFAAGLLVGDSSPEQLRERTPDADRILAFQAAADRLGRPRKELALHFALDTPAIAVTLVGMREPAQVDEIVRLATAPPLTSDEMATLLSLA
jgi:aryl-alcohol dehydrogenase-like predicted oxidoreductase